MTLAQCAPSWVDSQPCKVYIAFGETLEKIRTKHRENVERQIKSNPDWATTYRKDWADFPRKHMARHNEDKKKFLNTDELWNLWRPGLQTRLFDAPAICYLTLPKNSNQWSVYDLGAFGQTLMLAAKYLGIDSMPAYEIVRYPESVRKIMHIPEDEWVAMGIGLGYRADHMIDDFRSHRIALNDFLKIEK